MAKRRTPADRPPPSPYRPPPRNHLLGALPPDDFTRIAPSLDPFPLTLKETLQKSGEPARYVYFPDGGFISMLTVLRDGSMVEVATVGREGMAGLPAALTGEPSHAETFVQGEAPVCWRMPAEAFRREMDRKGAFSYIVTRYHHALFAVVTQATACNASHSVEQRLARWLLMAQDRMEASSFPLTQEFLAMMLGATRPTVTVVARSLQRAGLIRYTHARMTILDRRRLEAASCECYGTIKSEFDRLGL